MTKKSRKWVAIVAALIAALFSAIGCVFTREDSVVVINANKPPFIAAKVNQSFIVDKGGKVYTAGWYTYDINDLGDDKTIRVAFAPAQSLADKNITQVATSYYQSLALDTDGRVYTAGGYFSPLYPRADSRVAEWSMPQRNQPFTPALSLKGKKIVAVAAGQFGSWALGADGRLYASGADKRDINAFGRVADLRDKKIVAIAVGEGHLLALDIEGKVYGIGLNNGGQLGLGDHANRASFALVSSLADKKIVAIAAGESHSFAIDSNGKLYATGNNGSGRLGDGKREDQQEVFKIVSSLVDKNITQVAAGGSHSLALDADGKVYAAGYNEQGQLGLEGANYRDEFTLVSYFEGRKIVEVAPRYERSLGIDSEGYIVYCAEFAPVFSLADKNITQVAAGGMHSLALGADGKVYAAGSNRYGQLGLGDADIEAGYANARRVFMPVILSDR